MSSMDMLDVGQANEFKLACRRNGFTPEYLKLLCEGNVLADVRRVLLGHAVITTLEHLVDLDADPYLPDDWKGVERHQKGGHFKWDAAKVKLYLSKVQQSGKGLEGNKLREELKGQPVYNANLLEYLLTNPQLIPEGWRGKYVFFWGTIYRYSDDRLCVRYLYWSGDRWYWSRCWLGNGFFGHNPAAVCAS